MNLFREHIRSLPEMLEKLAPQFQRELEQQLDQGFATSLQRLYMTGCGDSYFAAVCAALALEQCARINAQPLNAMSFGRYAAPHLHFQNGDAMIGISVSGGVSRSIEAVLRARVRGLTTFAITSSAQTPIGKAAQNTLVTTVPDLPNASGVVVPGARSFYASLLMLVLMAQRLAQFSNPTQANTFLACIHDLPGQMQSEIVRADAWAREQSRATRTSTQFVFCGSGPNYGAALFASAKMIEACGDVALAQDVEEWAHLQYFARNPATTFVLGVPDGADVSRRAEVLTAMRHIGVAAIDLASQILADVPEVLSPFVTCIAPMLFAAHRAELLNESYFRGFDGGRSVEGGGGISRIRSSEILP